jgi:putative spermidine/putrescine transport system ATP-binding protein
VGRSFGAVQALRELTLRVDAGEFVTLLGPSGSGKTTALKLIAGFDRPSRGNILIDGRSVTDVPAYRRGIGMVFQNYALFPHLSVYENVAFPLRARDQDESTIRMRVGRALETVRLHGLDRRYPRELSGGQQQRVALARAIVFGPKLLLMDEPLGALDRALREQLKQEIKRIRRELAMTVLFVTHDQDEALVLSDRVAVMNEGELVQIAEPQTLYTHPRNRFVAGFLGESNLLRVKVAQGQPVLVDGTPVPMPPGSTPSTEFWLLLRPERIELVAGTGPGVLGIVREADFLGETTRYRVETAGQSIVVKLPNRGTSVFQPDAVVHLTWPPDAGVVVES